MDKRVYLRAGTLFCILTDYSEIQMKALTFILS